MQIHFALSERPRWQGDARLGETAVVHLTPGLDGVSRAVNEADRGLLPAEATVVVGQPMAVDPSRAPDGSWILWIQLQEIPSHPKGDAAGELDTGDGTWTETLREAYADRIQARIARHVPNLESSILRRVVYSPADIEAADAEHGRRRHLRRLVRARPEPALASPSRSPRPSHPRRQALAHRGEHPSGARASAPGRARSWRGSCSGRAWPHGC